MFVKGLLLVFLLLSISGVVQSGFMRCWLWEFECKNGDCVSKEDQCNGVQNCKDGSDELGCNVTTEVFTTTEGSTRTTRAFSTSDRTTAKIFLVPPVRNITATPDSELVIQCRVIACPTGILNWYKPDGELPIGSYVRNAQLVIPKVRCEDTGPYICYCSNPAVREYDVVELEVDRTICLSSSSLTLRVPTTTTTTTTLRTTTTTTTINGYSYRLPCENGKGCFQFCCNGTCVTVLDIPLNTFKCNDGTYIPNSSVCNKMRDCPDGSDEIGCRVSCLGTEFQCKDGTCIPEIQKCDGAVNCFDGSDESNCRGLFRPRPILLPGGEMEIDCVNPEKMTGGHVVQLECKFFGRPLPEVKWKKNEGHVPSKCVSNSKFGHGILVCPNFQQSDQGAYSCVGENSLGSAESQPKTLVRCKQITCENGFRVRDEHNVESCIECFCSGRTTSCHSLRSKPVVYSFNFPRTEVVMLVSAAGEIFLPNSSNVNSDYLKPIKYCLMPEEEVQSQRFMMSYGRHLNLPAVDKNNVFMPNAPDIIITGRGVMLTYLLNRIVQNTTRMNIRFWNDNWLHRDRRYASRSDIMNVLTHLEQLLIRCEYEEGVVKDRPFEKVTLESAVVADESDSVTYVEKCSCPVGYDGLSCESCAPGYKRDPITNACIFQPIPKVCPVGTTGDRCEECDTKNLYYSNHKNQTCVKTTCNAKGSLGLFPNEHDECLCKLKVTGKDCDTCEDGHFLLDEENPFGCKKCWCSNVTPVCESSDFRKTTKSRIFSAWEGFNETTGGNFWLLPSEFSGNLITSYGGFIRYTVKYQPNIEKQPKPLTVEILGAKGDSLKYVSSDLDLSLTETEKTWSVLLEEPLWQDSVGVVSREKLLFALTEVKAIFVESPYHLSSGKARITGVELDIAEDTSNDIFPSKGEKAVKVEFCNCPVGYEGTSCESCSTGYYRKRNGIEGYLCMKCECDVQYCDPVRGCEVCPKGKYYNNTTPFSSPVCLDCPCSGNEEFCVKDDYNLVMCFCKPGFHGTQCEIGDNSEEDFQVSISPIAVVNKKVGESVTFNCSYSSAKEYRIEFQKKYAGNSPANTGLFKVDNYGWCSTLDTTINRGLESVDCIVRDLEGEIIARVVSRVIGTGSDVSKPVVTNCYDEPKYAMENEDVYLRCDTTGSPEPEVSWHRVDKMGNLLPVNTTDGVHTIPSVSLAMNGTNFTCIARNGQGDAQCTTLLIVQKRCVLSIRPVNPEIDEGDPIEFNCTTESGSMVVWSRTDGLLPLDAEVSGGRLFFPKVKMSDIGEYKCTAHDPYGPSVKTTRLTVKKRRIPPTAEILQSDMEITEGHFARIQCVVTGEPLPKIIWSKVDGEPFPDNVRIRVDHQTLEIENARKENMGLYQCRAESFLNATSRILITVTETPKIEVRPEEVFVKVGETVNVECIPVRGEPYTRFGWENAHAMSSGGRLRFKSIKLNESGRYYCTAENKAGWAKEMVQIHVGKPPLVVIKPSRIIDVVPGDQVDVECEVEGYPDPEIKWLTYHKITLGRNRFHVVVNVLPTVEKLLNLSIKDDLESIVCEARNAYGVVNATLRFNLKSENPIILGRSKQVVIGTRAEMDFTPLGKVINCTRQNGPMIGDECYTPNGLEILNTQVQHSGTYKCTSNTGEMSYTIKVKGFVSKFTKQGMSYLILPVTVKSQQEFQVEITFKTERHSGILLLKKKHHAFSMYLKRGKLIVKLRRHSDEVIISTKKSLQLSVWHTAVFKHHYNAELTVYDEEGEAREVVMEPKRFEMNWLTNVEDSLYVGGVKASERHLPLGPVESHFDGCISRLIFDDHEYKMTEEGKRSENMSLCNVCMSEPNPCGTGSACFDAPTQYGFVCVCGEGAGCRKNCMGRGCLTKTNMCEAVKPCGHAENQCHPSGNGLKCKCSEGYSGITCEEEEQFEFSLDGNGYLKLPATYLPRNSIKEPEVISIAFTPQHADMSRMMLLSQGFDPNILELYMEDDSIVYVYDNQGKKLRVSGPIDLSNEYRVEITRRNNTATMKINNDEYSDEVPFSTNRVTGDIYIGWKPKDSRDGFDFFFNQTPYENQRSTGFQGCIHEITINGRKINTLAKDIVRRNIQRKCKIDKFIETPDDSDSVNDSKSLNEDIFKNFF